MIRICSLFALLSLLSTPARAAAPRRPLIAVFGVELRGFEAPAGQAGVLTAHLTSRLRAGGRFELAPDQRRRQALARRGGAPDGECYTRACQIEIGRAIAASFVLSTQIYRLGGLCVATSSLHDLRRGITSNTATARGPCAEASLLRLLDALVPMLSSRGGARTTVAELSPSGRGAAAELLVLGTPEGARVTVTAAGQGRHECRLPCRLKPVTPSFHRVEISAAGFRSEQRDLRLGRGQLAALSLDLQPAASGEAGAASVEPGATATPAAPPPPLQGLRVVELNYRSRGRHGVPAQVNFGVVVDQVAPGSRAARFGLLAGDVVLELNGARLDSVPTFRRRLARSSGRLRLLVHRQGKSFLIAGAP